MAKQKSSLFGWLISLIVVGGLIGGGVWYYRRPSVKPPELRTTKVARADIIQSVTANGQLTPVVTVQVGSQVSGNIDKLYADYNSKVTNGQLVAVLDPATYDARFIQAQSELVNAKAQANLARVNAKRAAELFKSKLISESDYDLANATLEELDAMVRIKEAALKSAQVDLDRTKIYSPIDGTVISRNVSVGQTVQASFTAPTLFNIAQDLRQMEIGAMVSEADIGGVEEKQEVNFTVEAFPTRTFLGRVSQVRNEPTTNQNVVTYATIIEVNNGDLKLKPGMTANVFITIAKKEKALRLPNAALRFRPPETVPVKSNTVMLASVKNNQTPGAGGPPDDGFPELPGGFQPPPEMRKRMLERYDKDGDGKLNADERKALIEGFKARMASGRGGGGGPGGGGGGGGGRGEDGGGAPRPRPEVPQIYRTVYLVSTNLAVAGKIELQPVQVKTGISDGSFTEIVEGLKEGDVVASGAVMSAGSNPAQQGPGNPFGGPFGGGGRRF